MNLLTLPDATRSIALGGLGNAVTQLDPGPWLHDTPIHYWGDLDVEGFEILSRLRQRFPQTRSLLMNQPKWARFDHLAIAGNPVTRSPTGHLSADELELCSALLQIQRRLEQERIPQPEVIRAVESVVRDA